MPDDPLTIADDSRFLDLQDQSGAYLLAHPSAFFAPIALISERKGELQTRTDKLVAKFSGLFINLLTLSGEAYAPLAGQAGGTRRHDAWLWCGLQCMVTENVTINRGEGGSGIAAIRVVEKLISHLHGWKPGVAAGPLEAIGYDPAEGKGATIALIVNFRCKLSIPSEVESPPITLA